MKKHRRLLICFIALLSFIAGALFAPLLQGRPVQAAQTFGPEDIDSVPPSFLLGGDRNVAVLREILAAVRRDDQNLQHIERLLTDIDRSCRKLVQESEETNRILRQPQDKDKPLTDSRP